MEKINEHYSCKGYIESDKRLDNLEKSMMKVQDDIDNGFNQLKEIKDTSNKELEILKDIVGTIKEELTGFKATALTIKWASISLVVGFVLSQVGFIETLKIFLR